jgi:hypothetical protein
MEGMAAGPSERAMAAVHPAWRGPVQVESIPAPELEGVRILHHIPDGLACVRDEAVRTMPTGQTFEELLFAEYKDVDVAEELADTNDLLPDEDGNYNLYVPPGEPVIIPEMCYPKQGADAVTLQSTGEPRQTLTGEAVVAGMIVIAIAISALVLLWKRLTD